MSLGPLYRLNFPCSHYRFPPGTPAPLLFFFYQEVGDRYQRVFPVGSVGNGWHLSVQCDRVLQIGPRCPDFKEAESKLVPATEEEVELSLYLFETGLLHREI